MKKLFGILTAGTVALSLTACGDEETVAGNVWKDGTATVYSAGPIVDYQTHYQIDRATVTVKDDKFTVQYDAFMTLTYAKAYYISSYDVVTDYETSDIDGDDIDDVFNHVSIDGTIYTFSKTVYDAGVAAHTVDGTYDGKYNIAEAYLAGTNTLAEYEEGILTDNEKAKVFVEAYEADKVKILQSTTSGAKSFIAHGSHKNLNKSHRDAQYWAVDPTKNRYGWKMNLESIVDAFENNPTLFDTDFSVLEKTSTDVTFDWIVDLYGTSAGVTVGERFAYAHLITLAYDQLEKN